MIKHYINESVNILYASDENFANFVEANSNHLNEGSNQNDFISSILSADNSTLSESLIGFKNQILTINNDIREFELFEVKENLKTVFRIAKSSNAKSRRILASIAKKDYELFENIIQVTSKKNIHQLISEVNSLTLDTDEKQLNEVFGGLFKKLISKIFSGFKKLFSWGWNWLTKKIPQLKSLEGFFKSLFFIIKTLRASIEDYRNQKKNKELDQKDIKDFKTTFENTINSQLAKMAGQFPAIDENSLPAFKALANKISQNLISISKNEDAALKFINLAEDKKGFFSWIIDAWKKLPAAFKEVEDIKKTADDEKARQALEEQNIIGKVLGNETAKGAIDTGVGIGKMTAGGALAGAGIGALASAAKAGSLGAAVGGLGSGALAGIVLAGSGALIVAGLAVIAMAVKKMIGAPNKYFKGEPVESEGTISGAPGSGVSGGGISRPQTPGDVTLMPQQIQGITSQIPNIQIPSGFNLGSFMQAPQAYPGLMPFYQVLQPNNLDNLTVGQLKALMQAFNQNKDKDLTDDVRQQIMQLLSGRGGVGAVQPTPTSQVLQRSSEKPLKITADNKLVINKNFINDVISFRTKQILKNLPEDEANEFTQSVSDELENKIGEKIKAIETSVAKELQNYTDGGRVAFNLVIENAIIVKNILTNFKLLIEQSEASKPAETVETAPAEASSTPAEAPQTEAPTAGNKNAKELNAKEIINSLSIDEILSANDIQNAVESSFVSLASTIDLPENKIDRIKAGLSNLISADLKILDGTIKRGLVLYLNRLIKGIKEGEIHVEDEAKPRTQENKPGEIPPVPGAGSGETTVTAPVSSEETPAVAEEKNLMRGMLDPLGINNNEIKQRLINAIILGYELNLTPAQGQEIKTESKNKRRIVSEGIFNILGSKVRQLTSLFSKYSKVRPIVIEQLSRIFNLLSEGNWGQIPADFFGEGKKEEIKNQLNEIILTLSTQLNIRIPNDLDLSKKINLIGLPTTGQGAPGVTSGTSTGTGETEVPGETRGTVEKPTVTTSASPEKLADKSEVKNKLSEMITSIENQDEKNTFIDDLIVLFNKFIGGTSAVKTIQEIKKKKLLYALLNEAETRQEINYINMAESLKDKFNENTVFIKLEDSIKNNIVNYFVGLLGIVKTAQPAEVKPTEPGVKPTEPEVKPTEPEVKPTEPEVKPTEPGVNLLNLE